MEGLMKSIIYKILKTSYLIYDNLKGRQYIQHITNKNGNNKYLILPAKT